MHGMTPGCARHRPDRLPRPARLVLALCLAGVSPVFAQDVSADTVADLRAEIQTLRAEQAERDLRIRRLEQALERLAGEPATAVPAAGLAEASLPALEPAHTASAAQPALAAVPVDSAAAPRLKVSGDLRLRGQGDWSDDDAGSRGSMQLRGRLGATFAVSDRITLGARLATGDGDDPNSTDVQLSNWLDDLEVSLDMAYARFDLGELSLYGGKMPQPFVRTDLVWDGDVNPQGLAAIWRRPLAGGGNLRAAGLGFIVDESAGGSDSTMLGAQLGYESAQRGDWKFDAHAAYFHYSLGSIAGADSGDFRSNLRDASGNYLSDFHLANLLLGATWSGLGERWPLKLTADYVHNTGAATDADTGYGVDLSLGRANAPGDWRVTWGHAVAETDAVLSAFSQDNIGIATNYRLHSLTVDYVPIPKTMLSLYWYRYRPDSALYPAGHAPDDWLDRLRLALLFSF